MEAVRDYWRGRQHVPDRAVPDARSLAARRQPRERHLAREQLALEWCASRLQLIALLQPIGPACFQHRLAPVHVAAPALEVVLEQGGAEALLSALPSAQPATRSTIIELLTRMAPLGEPIALHALTTLRR